jgi:hypothetical protein
MKIDNHVTRIMGSSVSTGGPPIVGAHASASAHSGTPARDSASAHTDTCAGARRPGDMGSSNTPENAPIATNAFIKPGKCIMWVNTSHGVYDEIDLTQVRSYGEFTPGIVSLSDGERKLYHMRLTPQTGVYELFHRINRCYQNERYRDSTKVCNPP